MAYIKSPEEMSLIIDGGRILGEILEKLASLVKPGISAWEIDQEAEKMILNSGGRPAFKGYRAGKKDIPFPSTICASINHELVHGIATKEKVLQDGDIFSIDIGMEWPVKSLKSGYFTDTAITVPVGKIAEKTKQLLSVTKRSLEIGIKQAQPGNSIADIGEAIEEWVSPQGYSIVRDLVGHGVGHQVHEEPRVPNYYDSELENWEIRPGVVIAIEPMITMGTHKIKTAGDGWSIFTEDFSLCAHFEHTIAVTEKGPIIATLRPSEKRN